MSWPNSQFSTSAFFGYNAGDNINSYSYPDSNTDSITSVSYNSNVDIPGKWIFMLSSLYTSPFKGSLLYTLSSHTSTIMALAALPEGNLASSSDDLTLKIWNLKTGSLLFTLIDHTDVVWSLAALANGNLASGSKDTTVKIWNPNVGSLLYTLYGHTDLVYSLTTLSNGNLVLI